MLHRECYYLCEKQDTKFNYKMLHKSSRKQFFFRAYSHTFTHSQIIHNLPHCFVYILHANLFSLPTDTHSTREYKSVKNLTFFFLYFKIIIIRISHLIII